MREIDALFLKLKSEFAGITDEQLFEIANFIDKETRPLKAKIQSILHVVNKFDIEDLTYKYIDKIRDEFLGTGIKIDIEQIEMDYANGVKDCLAEIKTKL